MKDSVKIVLSAAILIPAILMSSNYGAKDKSYYEKDIITGKVHSVTERSMEECEGKPHYSTVVVDGVERRCIKIK